MFNGQLGIRGTCPQPYFLRLITDDYVLQISQVTLLPSHASGHYKGQRDRGNEASES